MYWDRFDICEAYNLLAHDWGLYDVKARLDGISFRCAPAAEFYEGLSENGKAIFDYQDAKLRAGTSNIRSQYI
jgi:hypothetical protein